MKKEHFVMHSQTDRQRLPLFELLREPINKKPSIYILVLCAALLLVLGRALVLVHRVALLPLHGLALVPIQSGTLLLLDGLALLGLGLHVLGVPDGLLLCRALHFAALGRPLFSQ